MNRRQSLPRRVAVVVLSILASTALAIALDPILKERVPFLPFTLGVIVSSAYGGLYAGLSATVLSFLIADYFFIEPLHQLMPVHPGDVALLVLFLSVGIAVSLLHNALLAANAELRTNRERTKLAAQIGRIGFIEYSEPDRKLVWSPETETLFGLEPGTFEGTYEAWINRIHADDREKVQNIRAQSIAGRKPEMVYVYRALLPDGSIRWIEGRNRLFYSDAGQLTRIVGAKVDFTERELLERALNQTAGELSKSNQQLQLFAQTVSHDLREPLRGVHALTELLKSRMGGKLDQETVHVFDLITGSVERQEKLIRDLLDSTRMGTVSSSEIANVEMGIVLELAKSDLRALIAETGAKIESRALPTVSGRRTDFLRLLENLIQNGIKYRADCKPEIRISCTQDGSEWKFAVRDNGIGIAPADQQRIFEVFERGSSVGDMQGNGIGLATCKRIVEQHGGRIWVESTPGKGSTFYFTLPMQGQRSEQEIAQASEHARGASQ